MLDFLIPIDGAADSHQIDSSTSYHDFTVKVSDEMGVRRKDLNLAYKFTTSTQKELPQILNNEEHLDRLFERGRDELERHRKSKAKNKNPFKVTLIDRDSGTKKAKSQAKESKKASSAGSLYTQWALTCSIYSKDETQETQDCRQWQRLRNQQEQQ